MQANERVEQTREMTMSNTSVTQKSRVSTRTATEAQLR